MDRITKDIGARIKKLRTEKKLRQEDFANELNVSRTTLSHWESGLRTIGIEDAIKIVHYFKISLYELILGIAPQNLIDYYEIGLSNDAINVLSEHFYREMNEVGNWSGTKYQSPSFLKLISDLICNEELLALILKYKKIKEHFWYDNSPVGCCGFDESEFVVFTQEDALALTEHQLMSKLSDFLKKEDC